MSIELDFPEFPYAELPGGVTCGQKPWNGVLDAVTPADGSAPSTSQEAIVRYSWRQPDDGGCGPDA